MSGGAGGGRAGRGGRDGGGRHEGGGAPPRLLARLARTLTPPEDRGTLLPELEHLYRSRLERSGPLAARAGYLREVLSLLASRIRVGLAAPARGSVRAAAGLARDVSLALRTLRRAPGFTALTVGSLAVGIGAATLVAGMADVVLVRELPYDEPDRLVSVWDGWGISRGELEIIQERSRTLESVGAWVGGAGRNAAVGDETVRLEGAEISPGLLRLLGVTPAAGRLFRAEEGRPGGGRVVLLSHALWRTRFGGDPGVVGRTLPLDGEPHVVVGVLPPRFAYPTPHEDFLLPIVLDASNPGLHWGWGGHRLVGRLAPGATAEDVRREMLELHQAMRLQNPLWTPEPDARDAGVVLPLNEAIVGSVRPILLTLLAAVGVVLIVVCANVANLLLARGVGRRRDRALRSALGAGRWRIVREELAATLALAGLGAGLGLAGAWLGLSLLGPALEGVVPRASELGMDLRTAALAVVLALTASLLAGGLPAWRSAATAPGRALREDGRGGGGGRARRRLARTLVAGQVAAAVVLVVGAGLLVRTLQALDAVDPGFEPDGIVVARLTLGETDYPDDGARGLFFRSVRDGLAQDPAVESVALAASVPFGPVDESMALSIDGVTDNPNELPVVDYFRVSPGYFSTLGIPILEGRPIGEEDGAGGELVVVVDETAARTFWPGESPVGRVVRYPWRGAPPMRVVGVAGAVRDDALGEEPRPTLYTPFAQRPASHATVILRGRGGPAAAVRALRGAVAEVDRHVPVSAVAPYPDLLGRSVSRTRLTTALFLGFGAVALLLGCLGVYGVASYAVRERTREFGVRMALGARAGEILRTVLWDGLALAAVGVGLGLLLAVPAARLLEGLLFGVRPLDPLTLAAVSVALVLAVLAAVWVPARRATRVDPTVALGAE